MTYKFTIIRALHQNVKLPSLYIVRHLGSFVSQSSTKSSKHSFLTTLTEQVLLLLIQQAHMKEKHEMSEVFISLKY